MKEQQGILRKRVSTEAVNPPFVTNDELISETKCRKGPIEHLVQELRSCLHNSQVLIPESEGYAESIKRWSDAVEMRAVCED